MLQEGSIIARKKASATLEEMKQAMKINYFDDKDLIESQSQKFGQNN